MSWIYDSFETYILCKNTILEVHTINLCMWILYIHLLSKIIAVIDRCRVEIELNQWINNAWKRVLIKLLISVVTRVHVFFCQDIWFCHLSHNQKGLFPFQGSSKCINWRTFYFITSVSPVCLGWMCLLNSCQLLDFTYFIVWYFTP